MRRAVWRQAALLVAALALGTDARVRADEPAAPSPFPSPTPGIPDNSFLLEEAYNQGWATSR